MCTDVEAARRVHLQFNGYGRRHRGEPAEFEPAPDAQTRSVAVKAEADDTRMNGEFDRRGRSQSLRD